MSAVSILASGICSSIGMTNDAACAAHRAGVINMTETKFISSKGSWIYGGQVPLSPPSRGLERLAAMATGPLGECLAALPEDVNPADIPIILCTAERSRPGRIAGQDQHVLPMITRAHGFEPHASSSVLPYGRAAGAVGLRDARALIETGAPYVILVGVDSYLVGATLRAFEEAERLLTEEHSNGFPAAEAGSAVLIGRPGSGTQAGSLRVLGLGFGTEAAFLGSGEPFKANGMVAAVKEALSDASVSFEDIDYRIADLTGEHYYFKEASLVMTRILRERKEQMDIWHPTSEFGFVGAACFPIMLAIGLAAGRKNYGHGPNLLAHSSDDEGRRAAAVLQMEG